MEKLRVLYLITDLGKGGAERSITDLCHEFQQRNDVEFVIGNLLGDNQFKEITKDMPVINLNYKPNSLLKKQSTPKYIELLDSFKPHIVHSNRFLAEYITSQSVHQDVVYVCHGRDNMVQLANFRIKTLLNKRLLLNYLEKLNLVFKKYHRVKTYFVANSEHTKRYFNKVLPQNCRRNISIIENGVNLSRFTAKSKSYIQGHKLHLVNVGSFQPKKNQSFIVDIAIELRKRKIDFTIDLIGDGQERNAVQNRINENKLNNCMEIHGNVDNVEQWLAKSDIYLHTAWYEPFGIVFLEAMATGLPIVSLDGKGNKRLIKDNFNGFFIKEQNPKLFADKIQAIQNSDQLYNTLSENGKTFCRQFNMKQKAEEYMNYYKSLLDENIIE